jgi:extradiol dioxygenase family protein
VFHLAIPVRDIPQSIIFYSDVLGFAIGRHGDEFAIVDFSGCQLVLHRSDKFPKRLTMYPRHFGTVFEDLDLFELNWKKHEGADYVFEERFSRYDGRLEEHHTFFLKDPSNNLIEFKWYKNRAMIFGS